MFQYKWVTSTLLKKFPVLYLKQLFQYDWQIFVHYKDNMLSCKFWFWSTVTKTAFPSHITYVALKRLKIPDNAYIFLILVSILKGTLSLKLSFERKLRMVRSLHSKPQQLANISDLQLCTTLKLSHIGFIHVIKICYQWLQIKLPSSGF